MATLNIKNFPDPLYEKLKELARQEHRSLAQQVIHILQEAVDSESAFLLVLKGLGKELGAGTTGSSKSPQG